MSFLSNLNWRYATKMFHSTKRVDDATLQSILEAIRLTPTSFGLQSMHVTVVSDQATKDKLQAQSMGQLQIGTASHIIVFSARTDLLSWKDKYFSKMSGGSEEVRTKLKGFESLLTKFIYFLSIGGRGGKKVWSQKQTYIALGFAMAACAELEVDSCAMEGFSPKGYAKVLELPSHIVPTVVLPIGYRADEEKPRPKFRFDMSDIVEIRG